MPSPPHAPAIIIDLVDCPIDAALYDRSINDPDVGAVIDLSYKQATLGVVVIDSGGKPIDAVIPLQIRIEDAEGRVAERSGYWAAAGGKVVIRLDIAPNDVEGAWQVWARELASGKSAAAYFRVGEPPAEEPDMILMDKNAGNAVQPKG